MSVVPDTPAALRAADDRFTALVSACVDAIVLITPEGLVTHFNPAAERLFGYAPDEVLGKNVSVLMPDPYRSQHDDYIARYRQTGEARIIGIGREVVARRKDGTTFPIELSVGEFVTPGGNGFVGILRDITQRKQYEERLRVQAQELRLIFANAPMAFLVVLPSGIVQDVNTACCALFDARPENLQRRALADLMHPDDRDNGRRACESLLADGGSIRRTLRFLDGQGKTLHTQMFATVGDDGKGSPQIIIVALVDRGPLLDAAREAEELRSSLTHVARLGSLGEMVSGIAHELNQPLGAITNYAHAARRMLASGQGQPEELQEICGKIAAQGERAGQVIRGLRALARKRDEIRQPVDCNLLVREIIQLCEFEIKQSGFRVVLDMEPTLPQVLGDGIQIQQVILNLVRNAHDAMLEKAQDERIEVSTRRRSDFVEITVADGGPGIDTEAADRVGEPFFTTKEHGLGLGLSVCHSIVSAHNGNLRFERNARGGTTFRLLLPVHTPAETPA